MPVFSGNDCPHLIFDAQTDSATGRAEAIDALRVAFKKAGWTDTNVPAWSKGVFTTQPTNNQTVTLGSTTYTFKTVFAGLTANQILIGPSLSDSLNNLKDAVNRNSDTAGTAYTSATTRNQYITAVSITGGDFLVNARAAGGYGNNLVSSGIVTWRAEDSQVSRLWRGGYRFRCESPQGLSVQVYISDAGPGGNGSSTFWFALSIQMISDVNPGVVGKVHFLDIPTHPLGQYQIVVGGCSFWISQVGQATYSAVGLGELLRFAGTAVGGGVLRVDLYDSDVLPTEAWFSFANSNGSSNGDSPRTRLMNGSLARHSEGAWDGTVVNNMLNDAGQPRIMAIGGRPYFPTNFGTKAPVEWLPLRISDGATQLIYDPYVAWGNTSSSVPVIRGRIYDARIESKQYAIETLHVDTDDTQWVNYTNSFIKGCLFLKRKEAALVSTGVTRNDSRYIKPFHGQSGTV